MGSALSFTSSPSPSRSPSQSPHSALNGRLNRGSIRACRKASGLEGKHPRDTERRRGKANSTAQGNECNVDGVNVRFACRSALQVARGGVTVMERY
ncbi:hypothetical protein E2C01_020668 [Portunus trituberculatus]|uniref:Uncharacterized protein n=1 Tax=Portunus trituberculatus TaxID=210409 RepID=A0A5B7E155_PORTR|nr:hypothetical protein [Portunus trituberculatus]